MAELQGVVQNARIDQEGGGVVLRCVVLCENGERVPLEMRGRQIRGVLETGDHVALSGKRLRDRRGIVRPREIRNLTTNSTAFAYSPGIMRRITDFSFSLGVSVATGALTSWIVSVLLPQKHAIPHKQGYPGSGGASQFLLPSVLVGLVVGFFVFYLIYLRPKRR
jgi:hypothetical protein